MARHSRHSAVCEDCGNVEDLERVGAELLCRECRTCPHGTVYGVNRHKMCATCILDAFSIETHYGWVVADWPNCVAYGVALRLDWDDMTEYRDRYAATSALIIRVEAQLIRNQETRQARSPAQEFSSLPHRLKRTAHLLR